MRLAVAAVPLLLLIACAPTLPSEAPLGEGPLAKAEASARAKAEKDDAAKKAAGAIASAESPDRPGRASEAPKPKAPPKPDAGTAEAPKPKTPDKPDAGKKPGPTVTYAGEYAGSDESVYKVEGNERTEKDDKARTRVEVEKDNDLAVTFIDSGTGKDICTLKAKANGKSATFAAGQKCWDSSGMTGKLTRGSASFEDKRLVVDADFDLEFAGEGSSKMSGELHYHFDGTRK